MPAERIFHTPESVRTVELRNQYGYSSSEVIPFHNGGLPNEDPVYTRMADTGILGQAIASITARDQHFVMLNMAGLGTGSEVIRYKPFTERARVGQSPRQFNNPLILIHIAGDDTVSGRPFRDPIRIGQDFRVDMDGQDHFRITSLDAYHSTSVRYNENEEAATSHTGPDYAHARDLQPYELWRNRGNDGNPEYPEYIASHLQVRRDIVEAFANGTLYSTPDAYMRFLRDKQRYLAETSGYNTINGGKLWDDFGEFRTDEKYMWRSTHIDEAQRVAQVARRYRDPYGEGNLLDHNAGMANNEFRRVFPVLDIPERYWPYEMVAYDDQGNRVLGRGLVYNDGYYYRYPPAKSIPLYLSQATFIGRQIEEATKRGEEPATVRDLIAGQYQYNIIPRPFPQINNSLLMDLVNVQLKMLGYEGVTHDEMDHAAIRMRPDTFARYLADRVDGVMD